MNRISLIALVLFTWPAATLAQSTQPSLTITTDIEDGKKMVHVLVSRGGKPLENAVLDYFVGRTFGKMSIGEDTTLDDGTSAVAFPADLPGGADGKLHIVVQIKSPAQYAGTSASAEFPAGVLASAEPDPSVRALWSPHAPIALMVTIGILLAGVWGSYLVVINRVLAIRMGGKS